MKDSTQKAPFRAGFVALVGRPNVGKSTLLNRLVGEKVAITSAKAQTTRTPLRGIVHLPDRAQLVLVDTPGIHKPHHLLGEQLVKAAQYALSDVDLVILMVDGTEAPGKGDRYVAEMVALAKRPTLLVLNKLDRIPKGQHAQFEAAYRELGTFVDHIPMSAKHGHGLEALLDKVIAHLPESPPLYPEDAYTDQTVRAMAGEFVREQIFRQTGEEVPYSTAVLVERFEEREANTYIACTVLVERASQKGILIGKGGQKIKSIGQEARLALERLLQRPVYLDLNVKVVPDWREQKKMLAELGYLVEG